MPEPLVDVAKNLPLPCHNLAWPCLDLALNLSWPCPNLAWHCLDLALTKHWPCFDLALILPLNFGPNRVSTSWDIPDMDKCHQEKCCLDNVTVTVGICSRCCQEPTFKVWSVTAEIKRIWTNVTKANVAWTNVTITVGICSLNLPLKFDQNWVSNIWDDPEMDICRQDKCCLDKWHLDSLIRF